MLAKVNWSPTNKDLRTFGKTLIIGFAIIGAVLFFFGSRTTAAWAAGTGITIGLLAMAAPPLSRPFYFLWMAFGFVMGTVVSSVILTLIYFVILTPLALIMKVTGRDGLRLRRRTNETSYWLDHPALNEKSYYERLS